jgi:hypothetical protein
MSQMGRQRPSLQLEVVRAGLTPLALPQCGPSYSCYEAGHYRDAHGRLQTVKSPSGRGLLFARKSDAKNAAQEQEVLISDRRWIDPVRSKTTFARWAEHRLATTPDQRLSTRARDESYLRSLVVPPFGTMPLGSIEPVQVQNWVAELSKTHAPATVAKAYQIFARLMAAAEDSGYIARTPCRAIRLPRVEHTEMRFLSPGELERLTQSVPERHRALVLTAGYVGLRWGELAGPKTAATEPTPRQPRGSRDARRG